MFRGLSFVKLILIVVGALVLMRFLPLIMRWAQVLAVGVRAYWWAVLPAMLVGIVVWRTKRQPRLRPPMRDVTQKFESEG